MSFLSDILALLPDNVSKRIKPADLRASFEYVYEDMEAHSATLPPGTDGQIYEIANELPEKIRPTDRLTENEMAAASALTTLSGVLEELADIEEVKANKDASAMSADNIISWQEALKINELQIDLQAQIDAEKTARENADIAEANARAFQDGLLDAKITDEKNRNDAQDGLISAKLTKPSVSSDFLNYPSIVAVDALGNTAKVPSSGYDFLSLLFTENVKWMKIISATPSYQFFNAPGTVTQVGHSANLATDFPGVVYSSSAATLGYQRGNPLRIFTGWPYKVYRQFSIDTTISTQRIYIGYSENYRQANPTNVAISTLTNCIAICMESGNPNLLLVHNDASGSANIIDTGFTNATKYIYGFTLSQNYGDTNIYVKLDRLDSVTGATSSWTYTIASDYTNNFNHSAGIWVIDSLNTATVKVTDFGIYQTIRRNLP